MCNVSHSIFYVCGNSAVLDDCFVPQYVPSHIPTTTTKQNGMPHTCSCSFDPTNTWDGRSMGWTNEITIMCAHNRLNWHVGSVHMWNVLFQAPFAQSVEIYTTLLEYYWTTLSRCKFGNIPFNIRTNDHGQRWCVSNFLLAFFKPSKSYFRSRTMSWPCFRPSSPF